VRERIVAIDVLRGFAVLGILLMNIGAFALPDSALGAPNSISHNTGLNFAFWVGNELAVAGVFRSLFSMLFGAGVVLLTSRRRESLPPGEVADVYYRRNLWLMAFGMVHAYILLGWIDILFAYGLVGLFLYPVRRLSARSLALLGLLTLAVPLPFVVRAIRVRHAERAAVAAIERGRVERLPIAPDDSILAARWFETIRENSPTPEDHRAEIALRRSGYRANFRALARRTVEEESSGVYRRYFWDVGGMMLIGMALLKLGVLTASRSRRFYLGLLVGGSAAGLLFKIPGLLVRLTHDFDPLALAQARLLYDPGRLGMALGYVGAVMLMCQSRRFRLVVQALAAVGRTALSNYIFQTAACVSLFFGVGAGLFGRLERWQLLYVAAAIWCVQLVASALWLRRFRFGPLEWLWRSLTYWTRQPMRAAPTLAEPAGGRSPAG
jgi:uncharacterized protein